MTIIHINNDINDLKQIRDTYVKPDGSHYPLKFYAELYDSTPDNNGSHYETDFDEDTEERYYLVRNNVELYELISDLAKVLSETAKPEINPFIGEKGELDIPGPNAAEEVYLVGFFIALLTEFTYYHYNVENHDQNK